MTGVRVCVRLRDVLKTIINWMLMSKMCFDIPKVYDGMPKRGDKFCQKQILKVTLCVTKRFNKILYLYLVF